MTVRKIGDAARAVLPHLAELVGDEAEACREELIRLLEEDANGLNVDAALLQLFYDHAGLRQWLDRWLDSPESSRAARGRRRSPDFSATADEVKDPVQFRACTPSEISLDAWSDLVAYIHVPGAEEAVQQDVQRQLGGGPHAATFSHALSSIRRGAEIEVAVHLPHCHVNPPRASVLWLEDWHRLDFRVRVAEDTSTPRLPTSQPGKLSFHIGPLLVGEVPILTTLSDKAPADPPPLRQTPPVRAYRTIFCSYSHKDAKIVERLEAAYLALGDDYWRDVRKLRSGQGWSPEIRESIKQADIFQLFWSPKAKASGEVEKEWRAAHELRRPHFIRPVYWHKRIPKPPPELNHLHFAKLDIAG